MDDRYELNAVVFVWDAAKARRNERKHGVGFEQAAQAFFDPFLHLVDAGRNEESRDAVIGYDTQGRLLFVVHVQFEHACIRIVSARKATTQERRTYDS
ncbi:MAG: BrnT family toxin [Proteobacteria bacterium]|nr:BrnT family toxin [Pseudomonadota bacterium]